MQHPRRDGVIRDLQGDELDEAIVHEDAIAHLEVVAEILVRGRELTRSGILTGNQHHVLAIVHHPWLREIADANARTLKVAEDGDRALQLGSGGADECYGGGVLLMRAVREVQPRYTEAGLHEAAERVAVVGRGAERADDLRARE